jgi:hypothetical protein
MTYFVFLVLGFVLYAAIPSLAHGGHLGLFVASFCIILSMYGGGFSTVPAYLADLFGTQMVGAIHGRLLTAWAAAGVLGPDPGQLHPRVPDRARRAEGPGLRHRCTCWPACWCWASCCNLMVRPVADKHFMTDAELADEKKLAP